MKAVIFQYEIVTFHKVPAAVPGVENCNLKEMSARQKRGL